MEPTTILNQDGGNSNASSSRARLTEADRRKVVCEWNQTDRAYPRDRCFHQLFEAQAERTPEAIAVECQGDSLSYAELNRRANRLACRLQDLGVKPEALVGVCLEPSVDLLVALLAIFKAGGAYVPLDPTYPKERLSFMIRDSGIELLLTQESLIASFSDQGVRLLRADEGSGHSFAPEANPASAVQAENLAYVIYTSGSTGQPKGVMVPHRALVNYLVWAAEAYRIEEGCGALVHSSISFDLTVTGLFAPLLVGRCVYLLPAEPSLDRLAKALRTGRDFSLVKITPAHLDMLCQQLCEDEIAPAPRAFIIGGEALFAESWESWKKCAPAAMLVNEYGPTETVVGCCAYFLPEHGPAVGAVPIGRPIANTQLYVLNAEMEPVSIGATGELYVAGDGVARGYWNAPDLTAEKFVPNPFAANDNSASRTMYRTGDLVRYLPDGNLEFVGRLDNQIKVRSYRIEPAEIEAALLSHSLVQNAVVSAHNVGGDKQLAAYVIPLDGETPSDSELRAYLSGRLPEFMVPASFAILAELPLTPNGKIDRRALPPPAIQRQPASDYVPPQTEMEQRLARILGESLQRRVGLHDNFFDLGGHSLLAVRLVARINETFSTNLDALTFYQRPTVRELAGVLASQRLPQRRGKLIELRAGRGGPKIVFLNPPLELVDLANLMRDDIAFYISEAPFPDGVLEAAQRFETSKYSSLSEMIAPHVSLILESGLIGPIALAGYSSYGTVAFEVAHQLHHAGMRVAEVYLFDADMKPPAVAKLKVLAKRHARKLSAQGPVYIWDRIRSRVTRAVEQRAAVKTAREIHAPDAALSNGEISWRVFQRVWDHMLRDYRPRPLDSQGVLFRAATSIYGDFQDHDGCLGWRGLFERGLQVIEVPGDHVTMWKKPDVFALGKSWESCLQKLRRSASAALCSAPPVVAAFACSI